MKREEILAEIEELKPWFHCIKLAAGIKTKSESLGEEPVDHPCATWQAIKQFLPDDLAGKSVLDVGCNAGFYAVEAKRRHAGRVLGIDSQRHHIRQALFVKKVLGLDIEFKRMSVYDLSPGNIGQFDITLALGLIYHCKHLVLALENLFHVTKDMLIIETEILPTEKFPPSFEYTLGVPRVLHPMAYLENPQGAKEAVYNWFLPSPEGIQAIIRNIGFEDVSAHKLARTRAVLICRKRKTSTDKDSSASLYSRLALEGGDSTYQPRAEMKFRVRVENVGSTNWPAIGKPAKNEGAILLGAHLVREDETIAFWDYGRVPLESDLASGQSESLEISLPAPGQPGKYFVEFDMVVEGVVWFEDLGSDIIRHEIHVG